MNGICVKTLSLLVFLALINFSIVSADCPDFTFRCPTGESLKMGTCWSWWRWRCEPCRSITNEVRRWCRRFSCQGSVEKWYGRNDGCSAGFVSGDMTRVFGAACAVHDICYATPGRTKSQCDGDFHYNMQQMCKIPGIGSIGIGFCAATAGIAYLAVRDHGGNFPDFAKTCHEV